MDLPFDSVTKYSFWDEDSQILAKEKLPEAVSILVNDTCNFWIPNDATYAFSNLLNLLVKSNLSRQ